MSSHQINLLPPAASELRTARVYMRRGGHLMRTTAIVLLLIVLSQLGGSGAYFYTTSKMKAEDAAQTEVASEARQLVAAANATISMADAWFEYYQPWTPLFRGLLGAIPSNISLRTVELNEELGTLNIKGRVSTRVDVVNFQRQLEELDWVAGVEAPLSNFETGEDASFTFAVTRK